MHILLLIVYAALATYGIWKIPFLRKSGIRPGWLWLLFLLHVLTGWLHNWIAWRYFPEHGDIWDYFSKSFIYRHGLTSDLKWFAYGNSTWTYLTHNGIIFVQILLDLFSADNMTINTLLFSFPVFLGNVALYRVFRNRFPDDTLAATTVFWLPSVLFWTACIYREGMLYMLLGFLFYNLDRLFTRPDHANLGTAQPDHANPGATPLNHAHPRMPARRSLLYTILLFLLITYFRIAVATALIPALLAFIAIARQKARLTTLSMIVILPVLILSIPILREPLLKAVTTEQASFQLLEGHSRLPLPTIDGTLASIWQTLPTAIRNGFLEPLPGSGGQLIYFSFSIELLFIWLMVILAAIRSLRSPHPPYPPAAFPTACILFALTGMLIIGFFVPFAGAIVRYRSIYLPFLLTPALHALRNTPIIIRLNRWLDNRL